MIQMQSVNPYPRRDSQTADPMAAGQKEDSWKMTEVRPLAVLMLDLIAPVIFGC
jgi:hypothetical protein